VASGHRRLELAAQWPHGPSAGRLGEDAEYPGRGDGGVAQLVGVAAQDVAVAVRAFALEQRLPHAFGAGGGAGGEAVQDAVVARRGVEQVQHTEAAYAAHHRVHHALRQRAGEHGVQRVAAGREHGRRPPPPLRLRGDDHGARFGQAAFGTGHGRRYSTLMPRRRMKAAIASLSARARC
jgi:hypothetical protein